MKVKGKVSWFGGPDDVNGVAPDEPLAFINSVDDQPDLFLPEQPPGTTGLARRLDPSEFYVACRWNYDDTPPELLLANKALVRNPKTGKQFYAFPSDWGPGEQTGRVADVSPALMEALGVETDDEVEVFFPVEAAEIADEVPTWLNVMRVITGLTEGPGSEDNPKILAMRDYIARKWPEMAEYCDYYTHDDTPWCGLCAAFCVSVANIRPPFGEEDTECFLWALSWAEEAHYSRLDEPRPGCIVVMEREGGGHVTLFEREEDGMYICRGGNQSDRVNEASYNPSTVVALMWPNTFPHGP